MRFTSAHRGGTGAPLLCLHGFTDTWRTWELVLPELERRHDVLAPTLPGHAGGPPLPPDVSDAAMVDALEAMLDEVGWETAHVAGNSLGGYLALLLAERGRARSVVAFAPAGGWAAGDESYLETLDFFAELQPAIAAAAPHADAIAATPSGRQRATRFIVKRWAHIPADLVAHQIVGAASCDGVFPLIDRARRDGYHVEPEQITCPLRIAWGLDDAILSWPRAAAGYRAWFPQADWVELDGVGHSPQLDVPREAAQLILGFP